MFPAASIVVAGNSWAIVLVSPSVVPASYTRLFVHVLPPSVDRAIPTLRRLNSGAFGGVVALATASLYAYRMLTVFGSIGSTTGRDVVLPWLASANVGPSAVTDAYWGNVCP